MCSKKSEMNEKPGVCGNTIQNVRSGVEALKPVGRQKGGLEKKGAHNVVDGTNHPLNLAIPLGGVGTQHV